MRGRRKGYSTTVESGENTFGTYVTRRASLGFPLLHFESKQTRTAERHGDQDLNILLPKMCKTVGNQLQLEQTTTGHKRVPQEGMDATGQPVSSNLGMFSSDCGYL